MNSFVVVNLTDEEKKRFHEWLSMQIHSSEVISEQMINFIDDPVIKKMIKKEEGERLAYCFVDSILMQKEVVDD